MKTYHIFIVLILTAITFCHISDENSKIYGTVKEFQKLLPAMREKLRKSEAIKTPKVAKITGIAVDGKGFTKYFEQSDIQTYNGISIDDYDAFLDHLKNIIELPPKYQPAFESKLKILKYGSFEEIVGTDIMFAKTNQRCKYITILGQRNADKTIDILVGDIKADFELAPDIMIITQKKSALFGLWQQTITQTVAHAKDFTESQRDAIFDFFEIIIFERFGEAIRF